jgi:hypothetical protein
MKRKKKQRIRLSMIGSEGMKNKWLKIKVADNSKATKNPFLIHQTAATIGI